MDNEIDDLVIVVGGDRFATQKEIAPLYYYNKKGSGDGWMREWVSEGRRMTAQKATHIRLQFMIVKRERIVESGRIIDSEIIPN